jgi:cell division protein FtsQ
MTRKDSRFSEEEAPARPRRGAARQVAGEDDDDLDPRLFDLEPEEESPFLRGQKRVPVRRGPLPRKAAHRLKQGMVALAAVAALITVAALLFQYGTGSARFRLDSSDNLEVTGTQNVSPAQVRKVLSADLGRNIFSIPLQERKQQLEEIPWVESATVMRLLPNRLRVEIRERTPVAFVQMGSRVALIDPGGVVMELPRGARGDYSFPVLVGMKDNEPLSVRAARMKIYARLVRELDSGGGAYTAQLSEVDLSDPEDVKVTVADPAGAVLLHLGSANFLERYRTFLAHIPQWREQFKKVDSVDLRYERQVIVNPDSRPATVRRQ